MRRSGNSAYYHEIIRHKHDASKATNSHTSNERDPRKVSLVPDYATVVAYLDCNDCHDTLPANPQIQRRFAEENIRRVKSHQPPLRIQCSSCWRDWVYVMAVEDECARHLRGDDPKWTCAYNQSLGPNPDFLPCEGVLRCTSECWQMDYAREQELSGKRKRHINPLPDPPAYDGDEEWL